MIDTRTALAPLALGAALLFGVADEAQAKPADAPLSITNVLQAHDKVDGFTYQEVLPRAVKEVGWYIAGDHSLVTWKVNDQLFVYALRGENHVRDARALSEAITEHGIARAVVGRTPARTQGFLKLHEVIALQLTVRDDDDRR